MPLPRQLLEEMAASRAAAFEAAEREKLHDLFWSALRCVGWSAVGIFWILWSAHTTDVTLGKIAFFGGIAAGNGGIIYTLLGAYRRGERRGDW
jgi:hypothetical protein